MYLFQYLGNKFWSRQWQTLLYLRYFGSRKWVFGANLEIMQQTHIEQQPIGLRKRTQMNPMVETMSIIHCQWASERPFTKSMHHLSIPKLLRSQFDHFRISLYIKSREWPIFGVAWTISPLEGFSHPWKFGSSQTNASSPSTKLNRVPNWTCSKDVPVLNSLCYSRTEMNSRN